MKEQAELVFGRNAVREALRGDRDVDAVYISGDGEQRALQELKALAKKKGIPVKDVPKSKIEQMTRPFGFGDKPANHQGIAAQISGVRYSELEDIFALAEEKGQAPLAVALDGITDPQNMGAILRSAEVLGAHGVIVTKRRSAPMNGAACKSACGAEEYLPIVRVGNLAMTIEELKKRGMWVCVADMGGDTASKVNMKGPLCIVIGAEGEGVSRIVKEHADMVVSIPMMGHVESLNASCAAAVLLYEKMRQEAAI